uniref:CSON000915 protein n=1 Tax=Culicoides sonorensis TaxID=179676 RepID=A0A336K5S1_CULSO
MWPKKLNLSIHECHILLRNYELEAYSSVMSAFRSQGALSENKIRIMKDLRQALHISEDRHKAEIRRVYNDERLSTIADYINACETSCTWIKEGRRTVPIIPRGLAETALSNVADIISFRNTEKNNHLPHPSQIITSRPETILSHDKSISLEEKSIVFDEKVAIKLEERIPIKLEEDSIGWSRKRKSSNENINLNRKLYPQLLRQPAKKVTLKRPRKEKAAKLQNLSSSSFYNIDFENSINRTKERQTRDDEYNMRIIHSYASNTIPLSPRNVKLNENRPLASDSNVSECMDLSNTDLANCISTAKTKTSLATETTKSDSNLDKSENYLIDSSPQITNVQNPLSITSEEKLPKIKILSNNPVKIVPSLSLKTLRAKGNVQVVQSPPGKLVLRSFNNDKETSKTQVTEIKGIPQTIAGAKLSVQKVHLMPVQSTYSKSNANFLIVRNNNANGGKTFSTNIHNLTTKEHMNIPVSTVQTINIGKDGKLTCFPQKTQSNKIDNQKEFKTILPTVKNISSVGLQTISFDSKLKNTDVQNQVLQKVRLIPTSTTARSTSFANPQIKLTKDSKLYPITYSNGTPFTEMYVINKSNSPNITNLEKNYEQIVNHKVDWEKELDKKPSPEINNSSKVFVQSIPNVQKESISNIKNIDFVDDLSLEEIIEYESESPDDDDDKTVSQEEERSDIEVTEMVSFELEEDRIDNLIADKFQPISDKLSELAQDIFKD